MTTHSTGTVQMKKLRPVASLFGMVLLLGGCQHHPAPVTLPPMLKAPEITKPDPQTPSMEGSLPPALLKAPKVRVTEVRPKRPSRKAAPKTPVSDPPVTAADASTATGAPAVQAPLPEGSSVGELSAGGDANPKTQQEAAGLISASERRLDALSPSVVQQQQTQIRKVRYFLKQATQALSTGDTEGAKTLAMKAKLLVDDLEK